MLKLTCLSDLHIYPYTQFSTYDSDGVPSRLITYLRLAERIVKISQDHESNYIVIAGDVLNSSLNVPMTIYTAKKFLSMISEVCPVILTDGQHDMDTKSNFINPIHSIVSSLDTNRVLYFHNNVVDLYDKDLNRFQAYVRGWSPDGIKLTHNADIFIGHGIVNGSTTPDGYVFKTGIDKEELLSKYKLSVIGDIHNGVSFQGANGRIVLIPGNPVQNSFRDSHNCGIWTAELGEECETKIKFHRIQGPEFHEFITVDSESEKKTYPENIHVRVKAQKITKPEKVSNSTLNENFKDVDLLSLLETNLSLAKCENIPLAKSLLEKIFEGTVKSQVGDIPNTKIKKVVIEGFGNIAHYELDFDGSLPSPLLVFGANGTGKSTFIDSIYWALTGQTTKPLAVDKVVNKLTKTGCKVELTLAVEGVEYTIVRSRNHMTLGTSLQVIKDAEIQKSTMADTQNFINRLLGVNADLILSTCYLTSRSLRIFGELTDSNKYDLIGKLSNLEYVEALRETASTMLNTATTEKIQAEVAVNTAKQKITEYKSSIKSLEEKSNPQFSQKIEDEYKATIGNISSDFLSLLLPHEVQTTTLDYHQLSSELGRYRDKKSLLEQERESLNTSLSSISNATNSLFYKIKESENEISRQKMYLDSIKEKTCPTCKQIISDTISENLKKDCKSIETLEKELQEHKNTSTSYNNKYEALKVAIADLNKEIFRQSKILALQDRLRSAYESHLKTSASINASKYTEAISEIQGFLDKEVVSLEVLEKKLTSECTENVRELSNIKNMLSRSGIAIQVLVSKICELLSQEVKGLLSDVNLKAEISIVGNKPKVLCSVDGIKADYEELSSGEKKVIDIALLIAFNNILSRKFHQTNGLLGSIFIDEIVSFVDPKYAEVVFSILEKSLASNVIVITHDENLKNYFHNSLKVTKVNGCAQYEVLQ